MTETILANAMLVLPNEVIHGEIRVQDGQIAAIDAGGSVPQGAIDCEGDLLMPGLIELHTDNLERHIEPRPRVNWPHASAIIATAGNGPLRLAHGAPGMCAPRARVAAARRALQGPVGGGHGACGCPGGPR